MRDAVAILVITGSHLAIKLIEKNKNLTKDWMAEK